MFSGQPRVHSTCSLGLCQEFGGLVFVIILRHLVTSPTVISFSRPSRAFCLLGFIWRIWTSILSSSWHSKDKAAFFFQSCWRFFRVLKRVAATRPPPGHSLLEIEISQPRQALQRISAVRWLRQRPPSVIQCSTSW